MELAGRLVAFPTLHGKASVIAPVLERRLGVRVVELATLDTDRFGTFTGEVPRPGGPLAAARRKLQAAFEALPEADLALASEGSFGPHPGVPFVASGVELLLLGSRDGRLELEGLDVTAETNFAAREVSTLEQGLDAARAFGFPEHGVIVGTEKGLSTEAALREALVRTLAHGPARIETDMRAHLNPTRQRSLARAAEALATAALSRCPRCAWPGFVVRERVPGARCAECGSSTDWPRAERRTCRACAHAQETPLGDGTVGPAACPRCNP